ncbi:hypothetical protein SmJEL517_g03235 [Synchytrium microbalum]|uniref:NADP-dependent oxidoreductase domain-containing protein n=1 Tax=Synchytrium microbalum TaxID=1806994 RepID=A0A507C2Z0_9FUNG|nr:uncharacterized protein SmJEL517_g03235 [Synchytrium microbalum]TPX34062.1 hypothetical protein SmJEL517_g03235 [Synchytrium microbalum]
MAPKSTPQIVFGTMTFGTGVGGRISDLGTVQKVLDVFSSHGGTELDTARVYCQGNTEEVLGQLQVQKKYKLATKVAPQKPGDHQPERLKAQFRASLKALKTNYVDILYLHAPDRPTPFEDTCRAMNELHKEGLFGEFAISNYCAWEVVEIYMICKANGWVLPTIYQGMYNGITRDCEDDLLPCLKKYGIRFYAYNVGAGGLLSGHYKFEETPTDGRYGAHSQGAQYRQRYWNDTYFKAIDVVVNACKKANITPIGAAHRWLLHHSKLDFSDAIIIGASSVKHAQENLDACEAGPLPQSVLDAFDDAWLQSKSLCPTYHRGGPVPRAFYGSPRL